jgi:surface carbohydrate biosynthesis protein (TIGR04326 family)
MPKTSVVEGEGLSKPGVLWICWKKPGTFPPGHEPILSFLSPAPEEELRRRYGDRVIGGRTASLAVRAKAREQYLNLVARLGTVTLGNGLTWRQVLARPGEASRWWYHPVVFKDPESDATFQWILQLLTVQAAARRLGVEELVLVGAPRELAAALRRAFSVKEERPHRAWGYWRLWGRGLASRWFFGLRVMRQWRAARRLPRRQDQNFDVVISGFWDWSVKWDQRTQALADRYFKRLPDELRQQGMSLGWFAWLDLQAEPGQPKRKWQDALAPLQRKSEVVILQSSLRPGEIFRALMDVKPLLTFLKLRNSPRLKAIFQENGLDYSPLFFGKLLYGFLNASLPHFDLVALATQRAVQRYRPRVILSFLEHFPHSRSQYEGVRRAGAGTSCWAMQHASYNHEKTFLFLHPALEFRGEPDGCPVPHPDFVCAMGTLGQELFLECGYSPDRVLLTGSARYDYVRAQNSWTKVPTGMGEAAGVIRLLLVPSLDVDLELAMVEAVCTAVREMTGIKLYLRNHPFARMDRHPGFAPFKEHIEMSRESLEADLDRADLVIFTYSTVAEEAFLRGKPAWQWLPDGFNGSALAEVVAIPQFGTVAHLRKALRQYQANPRAFLPDPKSRQLVFERLFSPGDDQAASRMAHSISAYLANPRWEQRVPGV